MSIAALGDDTPDRGGAGRGDGGSGGGGGSGRGGGGDSGVPVTLPYDPDDAKQIIARVEAMKRGEQVAIRPNPKILDDHFGIGTSQPIVVRWLERQHIFSDRVLTSTPEQLVQALMNPREIVENRKGETWRKRPRRRALFYGSGNDEYDLAIVVEFLPVDRSRYVVSVFSPTKSRTVARQRNEPVIWEGGDKN